MLVRFENKKITDLNYRVKGSNKYDSGDRKRERDLLEDRLQRAKSWGGHILITYGLGFKR